MKKTYKHLFARAMAGILMVGCLAGAAFAEGGGEQTTTIPVTLTIVHSVRNLDVTMPVSMPVSVLDGTVLTANNVEIINNSTHVDVEVVSVRVEGADYNIGDFDNFPEEDNEGLIAMKINGCSTKGPGPLALTETAFPVIRAGKDLPIEYRAKVGDAHDVSGLEVAHVVFTLRAVETEQDQNP